MLWKKLAGGSLVFGMSLMALACGRAAVTAAPLETAAAPAKALDGPAFADVGAVDVPVGAEATTLSSEVKKVVVFSDRAQITRQATAEATTEPQVFAFRKLPGWVDDGSVRVSVTAGRIVDVRAERSFLARTTDANYRKAEDALRIAQAELAEATDEIAVLDAQKAQIESIKAFSLDKITKDTLVGNVTVQSYGDVVAFISSSLRETAKARRQAQARIDEIQPRVAAAQRALDDMRSLLSLEETTVFVTLQASRPASSVIELTYMIPGATWEPMHELRVSTADEKKVEVASFAVVTQTSGEDWGKAELSFSTQSAIESVRIPELEALTLGDTTAATRILTSRMSSFSRAQQAFEGQSRLWNKVNNAYAGERANFEQVYESNMELLQVVQSKTVRIFETLKSRGTTAHFKALAAHSVRGDGHPTRMRIGTGELDASQVIIAVPEQTLNAARTLEMVNATGQSLLPGKVALYQDGAFIGMTDIDFIADGERFSLFLNVADHIKLSRTLDRKQSSLVHKKQNKMTVTFAVTVENLSNQATGLMLADRIPVSENKEITISNVKVGPSGTPDSQGILRWKLALAPKEKREFSISYQVEYPSELILDARRKRALEKEMPNPAANSSTPASPMAAPAMKSDRAVEEQLMDLEEML